MMKQFLISNMCNDTNKGDLSILENTVYLLKGVNPESKIIIQNGDYTLTDIIRLGINRWTKSLADEYYGSFFPGIFLGEKPRWKLIVFGLWNFFMSCWLLLIAKLKIKSMIAIPRKHRSVWQVIRTCDLVVVKGGSYLYSYGRLKDYLFLYRMLLTPRIAILLGKKVVLLGHSIGPIEGHLARWLTKSVLSRVVYIGCRESFSLDYIMHNLQISGPTIELIPDLAFLNETHNQEQETASAKELLAQEGIQIENKILVGITVRNWDFPGYKNPVQRIQKYQSVITTLIGFLREKYQATLIFIPHCLEDIPFANKLYDQLHDSSEIYIIKKDYTTQELKRILRELKLLIGTRIHSNILALLVGTPVIPIAYEIHKGFGIMEMAGIEKEYIFNIANLELQKLKTRIEYLMSDAGQAKERSKLLTRSVELKKEIQNKIKSLFSEIN